MVQVRALLEGVPPATMLSTWHELLPQLMQRWALDRGEVRQEGGGGGGEPQSGVRERTQLHLCKG